jgi:hypothetical protein
MLMATSRPLNIVQGREEILIGSNPNARGLSTWTDATIPS